jgi:iron complex transport system substrate-binding protein
MFATSLPRYAFAAIFPALVIIGCAKSEPAAAPSAPAGTLVVENCGRTLRFDGPPRRVIATGQAAAELLARLGVKDPLIGIYYADPTAGSPAAIPELKDVPRLSESAPPSKEVVLPLRPDFVLAQFPTADLDPSRGGPSREDYESIGSPVFEFTATTGDPARARFESFLTDVDQLGRIFRTEAAAGRLVADIRSRLAAVRRKTESRPKLNVVLCFSGNDQMLGVFGAGVLNELIDAAGGRNVYGGEKDSLVSASREDFAIRPIDCYVVIDVVQVPSLRADKTAAWLFATFPETSASKQKRYVGVSSEKMNLGHRTIEAVEEMARAFHPEAFLGE